MLLLDVAHLLQIISIKTCYQHCETIGVLVHPGIFLTYLWIEGGCMLLCLVKMSLTSVLAQEMPWEACRGSREISRIQRAQPTSCWPSSSEVYSHHLMAFSNITMGSLRIAAGQSCVVVSLVECVYKAFQFVGVPIWGEDRLFWIRLPNHKKLAAAVWFASVQLGSTMC
jgi:hypothetical protein